MEYQKVDLITSMTELIKVLSIRKLQNVFKNQNYIRANLYKTTNKWVKKQSGEQCSHVAKIGNLRNFAGCET